MRISPLPTPVDLVQAPRRFSPIPMMTYLVPSAPKVNVDPFLISHICTYHHTVLAKFFSLRDQTLFGRCLVFLLVATCIACRTFDRHSCRTKAHTHTASQSRSSCCLRLLEFGRHSLNCVDLVQLVALKTKTKKKQPLCAFVLQQNI